MLAYPKFKLTIDDRDEVLGDYLPWCETISVPAQTQIPNCRDPFARPFLALAVAAKADALITGDKDLLELANDFEVPILTPAVLRVRLT